MAVPIVDDEVRALVRVGFVRPVDFIMGSVFGLYAITTGYWWLFAHPSAIELMTAFFGLIIWLGLWTLLILFRACRFIVEIRAAMELLPVDAAKALHRYITAGAEAGESVGQK
jgi:hypothetical protein